MTTLLYFFFPEISNYPSITIEEYITHRMVIDNRPARLVIDNPEPSLTLEDGQ